MVTLTDSSVAPCLAAFSLKRQLQVCCGFFYITSSKRLIKSPPSIQLFSIMVTTGKTILESQPQLLTSTPRTGSVSDQSESEGTKYDPDAFPDSKEKGSTLYDVTQAAPLAPGVDTVRTPGDALLHFLKIRKDPRWDPGAVSGMHHARAAFIGTLPPD